MNDNKSKKFNTIHYTQFIGYKRFNIHKFKSNCGFSLGIHLSQTKKRIDIHFLDYIISLGKVPIYKFGKEGKRLAVSDTYHERIEEVHSFKVDYAEPTNDLFVSKNEN